MIISFFVYHRYTDISSPKEKCTITRVCVSVRIGVLIKIKKSEKFEKVLNFPKILQKFKIYAETKSARRLYIFFYFLSRYIACNINAKRNTSDKTLTKTGLHTFLFRKCCMSFQIGFFLLKLFSFFILFFGPLPCLAGIYSKIQKLVLLLQFKSCLTEMMC